VANSIQYRADKKDAVMATIGIWKINPFIGGTEVSLIEMARFLRQCGHEVWVYGSDRGVGYIARELGVMVSPESDIWNHKHDVLLWYDDYLRFPINEKLVRYMKEIPHRYGVFGGFAPWLASPVFDKAIAKSSEISAWLEQRRIETAIISQFPITLDYWKSTPRENKSLPIVGYVGRVENKNLKQLVSIAKCAGNCHVKFTVNDRTDTEGVRSLGCEVVAGQPLMKPAYQEMDIFMMTSLMEGVPRVIMEAMAMSLPVVVWGIGGISTLGATYTLPPNSEKEAVSALQGLVQNYERRRDIGSINRSRIEEYDSQIRNRLSNWLGGML